MFQDPKRPVPQFTLNSSNTWTSYAFLLFPPFLALDPVVSAASPPPAIRASRSSLVKSPVGADAKVFARLGSSCPMTGTVEASMVWKGVTTKWPFSSNHSVNARARLMVCDFEEDFGVRVMVRL